MSKRHQFVEEAAAVIARKERRDAQLLRKPLGRVITREDHLFNRMKRMESAAKARGEKNRKRLASLDPH